MKSFVNDLYDYDYTGGQAENNEEESGNGKEINIKLKERGMQQMKITKMLLKQTIVLDLKKNVFH